MKYVFDSRDISEKNPPGRRDRPIVRGGAVPFSRADDAPATQRPSWIKSSGLRVLVMVCVLGVALYMLFREAFLYCLGKWLLVAVFMPLVAEGIVGLLRNNAMRPVAPQEREVRRRRWNVMAWCLQLLVCIVLCGVVYMVFRRSPAYSELPRAEDAKQSISDRSGAAAVSDRDIVLHVESTEGEMRQLFEYVRQSAFVQENRQYAALMEDVVFVFDATNNEVNAVASRRVGADGKELRAITCYAGEARFAKTISLAAAAELSGIKGSVGKMMEKLTPRLCFSLNQKDAVRLVRECGLDRLLLDDAVRAKAKSIAAGGVVGTLAHEVGHQVLGHNFQHGKDMLNNEIRRNFETQADLFASSVMSSSPFGEYVFAGRVFALWVSMRRTDPLLEMIPARELDHPINRERFIALVLANKEKAAALGIEVPSL